MSTRDRFARLLRVLVPLIILAAAAAVVWLFAKTKEAPARSEPEERATEVEILRVEPEAIVARVEARGRVQPAQRLHGSRGRWARRVGVERAHAGRALPARADNAAHRSLRVSPRRAGPARRAQPSRRRPASGQEPTGDQRASVGALQAWARGRRPDPALVLNLPQLEAAEEAYQSAKIRVEQAELDVRRTALRAPFNAVVESEDVDVGQRIGPAQPVLTLVGTDHYWVRASIEVSDVPAIRIPKVGAASEGSPARISYTAEGATSVRRGHVLRLQTDLEPEGSMARVIIEVDDPLGFDAERPGPPLLIGAFVDVEIDGETLSGVYKLPRQALHEGDQVRLMNDEGRLSLRRVEPARRQRDHVIVRAGLSPGDRVVLSPVPLAIEGLKLTPKRAEAR